MDLGLVPVYRWATVWSRAALFAISIFVVILKLLQVDINLTLQVGIAIFALLVGVPHGAVDHLISIQPHPRSRFYFFIFIYSAIAITAGWAIAQWNVVGFQIVVVMSALHFGFGDASFISESRMAKGEKREPLFTEIVYAIAAGFAPLILPLTDHRTTGALNKINPQLDHWAGSHIHLLRSTTLIVIGGAGILFLIVKKFELLIDLLLIATISFFTPPLIAFAAYFGLWHAVRHTARLVPKLPTSLQLAHSGAWKQATWRAVWPGLYAVVGTFGITLLLTVLPGKHFSTGLLWPMLVIIWALTVPHMLVTARFDLTDLKPAPHNHK